MGSVKDFYADLSDSQRDVFLSVINELQSTAPEGKISRLESFFKALKSEIDAINRRRQSLGNTLSNVETLAKYVDNYVNQGEESLEIVLLRASLEKVIGDLKAEIAALKPERKLAKKFDVARRISSLTQRRDVSTSLFEAIFGRKSCPSEDDYSDDADVVELTDSDPFSECDDEE